MEHSMKKGRSGGDTMGKSKSLLRGSVNTGGKVIATTRKLMEAPQRLLEEEDINELMEQDLCQKCRDHCEGFVHLTCGRGAQHVNQDIEINELIIEINHTDILDLLIVEKGSTAKMMI